MSGPGPPCGVTTEKSVQMGSTSEIRLGGGGGVHACVAIYRVTQSTEKLPITLESLMVQEVCALQGMEA